MSQSNRWTTRHQGKTRNHRRRDDLQFLFHKSTLRREAILQNLAPWVVSEYKKASHKLGSKKEKPLRRQREVLILSHTADFEASP